MTCFAPADPAARDRATDFVGRIAQLDPAALVRLTEAPGAAVDLWAKAGFGVMACRRVPGRIDPDPLTVYATNLVAALAVSAAAVVDAGADAGDAWFGQLPPATGWMQIGAVPAVTIAEQVSIALPQAQGAVEIDRAHELRAKTKATVPPAILDRPLLTIAGGSVRVPLSMRMLFALSGMGFVAPDDPAEVTVHVTATWLRLDTAAGSVARRRMADLPLT